MTEEVQEPNAPGPGESTAARWDRAREVSIVVLLAVTAIITAWCGFEASKWGGEMSIHFSQASAARIEASDLDGKARDSQAVDVSIYELWLQARATGNASMEAYVKQRFTPQLKVAFADWEASGQVLNSPFAEPSYVAPGTKEAEAASKRADQLSDDALTSNRRGDNYSLLTVLFALVLFFAAVSDRSPVSWGRWALLGIGLVAALAGVVLLATFPILV